MGGNSKQRGPGSLKYLVMAAIYALAALSLAAYAPVSNLWTDIPSHFPLQYAIAAVVLAGVVIADRYPRYLLAVLGLCFALNFFQLMPLLPLHAPAPAAGKPLRILQVNTLFLNKDTEDLKALIAVEDPDVIFAAEVNADFADMFRSLKPAYPRQEIWPQDQGPRGMALLSKYAGSLAERKYFDDKPVPALDWTLNWQGRALHFLSIHPFTPLNGLAQRDASFKAIAANYAQDKADGLVVLGDFNATFYCPALKQLTRELNLRNAREGMGLLGSWPAGLKLPFLRIPIDNLLLSPGLSVEEYRLGPDIGSDHLPSLITIAFTEADRP